MTISILHKRSNVEHKRPTTSQLQIGELSLNYHSGSPGLFFEDSSNAIRKIGPCEVGGSIPNSSPTGSSGNSVGELWFDTSSGGVIRVYDGSNFSPSLAVTSINSTPPANKTHGSLWYSTQLGRLFVYYNDGDTEQWVDTSPASSIAAGVNKQVQFNSGGSLTGTSLIQIESDHVKVTAKILPEIDNTVDLGSSSQRFANIYTGDLHLKNDRGDWTLIEEDDCLTIRNNKTGKIFNFVLEERS
jgi:hypothetical protein